jgi:hypothetical protein
MKRCTFFTLFCLILSSCGVQEKPYYYVSDAVKRFADFNVGSYWIYHNDALAANDTIRVVDHKSVFDYGYSDDDEFFDERIEIRYKSSYDSAVTHDNSIIIDELLCLNGISRTRVIADTSNYEYFHYWFKESSYLFDCELNGVNYDTIVFYKNSMLSTYPWSKTPRSVVYYFSPDHGAIRKIYQDDSTLMEWNLVDYHIVR